jgi:hypothetical protein
VLPETAAVRAATGQPPKLFRIYEFGNFLYHKKKSTSVSKMMLINGLSMFSHLYLS